jgi:hypothetical protein
LQKQRYEHGGRLKIKIQVLFCGENSLTTALRQMKFGTVKYHVHDNYYNITNNFSTHLFVYHTRFSHQVVILSGSKKLVIWFTIW